MSPRVTSAFLVNKPEQNVACASVLQCDWPRQGVASRALAGCAERGGLPLGKKQKVHRVELFQIFLRDDVASTRIEWRESGSILELTRFVWCCFNLDELMPDSKLSVDSRLRVTLDLVHERGVCDRILAKRRAVRSHLRQDAIRPREPGVIHQQLRERPLQTSIPRCRLPVLDNLGVNPLDGPSNDQRSRASTA